MDIDIVNLSKRLGTTVKGIRDCALISAHAVEDAGEILYAISQIGNVETKTFEKGNGYPLADMGWQ